MPLRDDLLQPLPGDNPCGSDLRYSPLFDQIREGRRSDDPALAEKLNTGQAAELKKADHRRVVNLTQDALATKSKDLWLVVWLAEALTYQERFAGLLQGLNLLNGLISVFWDHLYPELEDGDVELRVTPLEWFGNYFEPAKGSSTALAVRLVPLTQSGISWIQYKEMQKSGGEALEKELAATPKSFYRTLDIDLSACRQSLQSLDELCRAKFGEVAPSFNALRSALLDVDNSVHALLMRKLALEPDPEESTSAAVPEPEIAEQSGAVLVEQPVRSQESASGSDSEWQHAGKLTTGGDAVLAAIAAARFLFRANPSDPVPYLLVRALRWGELRGAAPEWNGLLAAPPPELRIALRNSAKSADWKRVLGIAEDAMSAPCGRAWLDLQRYTITACEQLKYEAVARCLRSELRLLLTELPSLVAATLVDDTGTANPDTLSWLRAGGFIS